MKKYIFYFRYTTVYIFRASLLLYFLYIYKYLLEMQKYF